MKTGNTGTVEYFNLCFLLQAKHVLKSIFFTTRFKGSCFLVLFFLLKASGHARAQVTSYAVYANIIYHFTKYIDWPGKQDHDFVIGIVGESPLYDELKSFIGKISETKLKIVVRKLSPSASSYDCNILFVSEEESGNLKKISNLTAGDPILILSESPGLARKGSCINFITSNDRLKLEINKENIEHRKLEIATELLNMGVIIK